MHVNSSNFFSERASNSQISEHSYGFKDLLPELILQASEKIETSKKCCKVLEGKLAKAENEVKQLQAKIDHCKSGKAGKRKRVSLKRQCELSQSRYQELTRGVAQEKLLCVYAEKIYENLKSLRFAPENKRILENSGSNNQIDKIIKIFIKFSFGNTYSLTVSNRSTFLRVKELLAEKISDIFESNIIEMTYSSRFLRNHETLQHYGVDSGSTLFFVAYR